MEHTPINTTPPPSLQNDEEVEIEIHQQKPGMTGRFRIREPSCPKGKTEPCKYRPPPNITEMELSTLKERNKILEDHARSITNEFDSYKKLTEARFEKLTNLFLSLNK